MVTVPRQVTRKYRFLFFAFVRLTFKVLRCWWVHSKIYIVSLYHCCIIVIESTWLDTAHPHMRNNTWIRSVQYINRYTYKHWTFGRIDHLPRCYITLIYPNVIHNLATASIIPLLRIQITIARWTVHLPKIKFVDQMANGQCNQNQVKIKRKKKKII